MYQSASIKRRRNPRETAGFFSVFAFLYTTDIFRNSRKRDLVEDDLYEPINDQETHRIGEELQKEWTKEVQTGRKSLTRAMIRVFGKTYFLLGLAGLIVKGTIMTITPLVLGRLVSFFAANSQMTVEEACIYGAILLICGFIANAFNHHYHLIISTLGIKIKASLASLIYRKSLKLTVSSLMELTSGKLVTLITKDAVAFESAISFFHELWIGVGQLMIMSYILYKQLQEAAFIGIFLLLCFIPIQVYIARFTKAMRLKAAAKTDERIKRMQEILTSIKLLKLYNWVDYYTKITSSLRTQEVIKLRYIFYLKDVVLIISQISQRLSFFITLAFYTYMGNAITAEKIFVVMGCYDNLRVLLSVAVPMCVSQFADARSSMKRIKHCLISDEIIATDLKNSADRADVKANAVRVDVHGQNILENINFEVHSTSLIGITGNVGSGKSTFLKMLLKDVHLSSGTLNVHGSISYASQEPWLFPGTIKQNILFGLPMDIERYHNVLRVCALVKDLENFEMRDETIVSDKGLNLSKGQQARINLARAVYKQSDIYLLDDVMVALDASVSQHLFENCLQQFLKDKMVIFVCHNKKYLKMTDRIVVMAQGTIQVEGRYEELVKQGVEFNVDSIDAMIETKGEKSKEKADIVDSRDEDATLLKGVKDLKIQRLYAENKQEGKVEWSVYKSYLQSAGGWKIFILVVVLFIIMQGFFSSFDLFLTTWIKVEEHVANLKYNMTHNLTNITKESAEFKTAISNQKITMQLYAGLIVMSILSTTILIFGFFTITTVASKRLHNGIFTRITGATMNFFDTNLSGNVLNRFSKDIGSIDEALPYAIFETFRSSFLVLGIGTVICIVNKFLILPTVCMLLVLLVARRIFLNASRGIKRLDGSTSAPVIGFLTSSLEGLTTIRACRNQELLITQFERHQDLNTSAMFMFIATSRAFGFWISCFCEIYITSIIYSLIFLIRRGEGSSGNVGVALTQAFILMELLQWSVRQSAQLENEMTCVERVCEYNNTEQEKRTGIEPDNWPTKGHMEYRNVCMSYFTGKPVLRNINLEIHPGERIGIVGRTGAGKSSIISALFRLYPIDGSITIDGVDIKDIELAVLRSKISIIPQDPVLFAGTIRSNLDPEGEFTDLQLWHALGEVKLKYEVETLKEGLSTSVEEGGGNFSIGQRQLISLARAVLRDNQILVLDEATANIDPITDELIQKSIKRLFSHCTILTIAHKLHTVIDSDRIVVVDDGRVIDFESPAALIQRGDGIFYDMAKHVGLAN